MCPPVVHLPRVVQQFVPCEHDPGVREEVDEQVVLLLGEAHRLLVDAHLARAEVDGDACDAQAGRIAGGIRPAHHGLHARHQLPGGEGFGDVVVGAELEAGHPVCLVAPGGEDDDRDVAEALESAQHVEAVHVGEADVEQHQGERPPPELAERLAAVARPDDPVLLVQQVLLHEGAHAVVVLDEQDRASHALNYTR